MTAHEGSTMAKKTRHALLLPAALACLLAAGCDRAGSPAPDAEADIAAEAAGADAPRSFVGRKAAEAIEQAARKLRTENIEVGKGSPVHLDGRDAPAASAGDAPPRAEITPTGELLIAGTPVDATPAQQALLLEHRRQLEELVLAGMAVGVQGADIAGTALDGIGKAIFGGEDGRRAYEARMEAEAARIRDEATRLCALLPPLYASQEALAGALPAFLPYATMTVEDAEDCGDRVRGEVARILGGTSA